MTCIRLSTSPKVGPAVVLGVGAVAAIVVAALVGATAGETVALVAMAGGGAAVVIVASTLLLRRLAGASLTTHLVVVAVSALSATFVGVAVAAQAMFLSGHDLGVLAVVLVLSVSVGASGAWMLAGRLRSGLDTIGSQIDRLDGDEVGTASPTPFTADLARLSDALNRAHTELVATRGRSRRLEASRRELVAWVSHDLRSPIGALRAMAEALEDGVVSDPDEIAAYHRAMRQETERLTRLVDDLFELARIQAGAPATDVPFVPLPELVSEILEAAAGRAAASGVDLRTDVDELPAELVVAADVRRAVDNVLDNAIRHTPAGGSVRASARADGRGLDFVVLDECGGIPDDDLQRVFDVAFRGDASRPRDTDGAGLGLAIAKGLLEARAGDISVRNRAGGCEFTVRLPAEVGR